MRTAALWVTILALGAFGCQGAAANPDDLVADTEISGGKTDGDNLPLGAYYSQQLGLGSITVFVIRSDKTFHYEQSVECRAGGACPQSKFDGEYKFTSGGATRYIRLTTEEGDVQRFAFTLSDATLKIREVGDTTWRTLENTGDGWCDMADDCQNQGLPQPRCPGAWLCAAHTCDYDECQPIPTTNKCKQAGGFCTGLRPGGCGDDVKASAEYFPCSAPGALGVMCCLPAAQYTACEALGGACVVAGIECPNDNWGDPDYTSCNDAALKCCLQ
jgi:hypothetical protein